MALAMAMPSVTPGLHYLCTPVVTDVHAIQSAYPDNATQHPADLILKTLIIWLEARKYARDPLYEYPGTKA